MLHDENHWLLSKSETIEIEIHGLNTLFEGMEH